MCRYSFLRMCKDDCFVLSDYPDMLGIWNRISNKLGQYAHGLHKVRSNFVDFHGTQVGQLRWCIDLGYPDDEMGTHAEFTVIKLLDTVSAFGLPCFPQIF